MRIPGEGFCQVGKTTYKHGQTQCHQLMSVKWIVSVIGGKIYCVETICGETPEKPNCVAIRKRGFMLSYLQLCKPTTQSTYVSSIESLSSTEKSEVIDTTLKTHTEPSHDQEKETYSSSTALPPSTFEVKKPKATDIVFATHTESSHTNEIEEISSSSPLLSTSVSESSHTTEKLDTSTDVRDTDTETSTAADISHGTASEKLNLLKKQKPHQYIMNFLLSLQQRNL
ncbi:hypothetical protein CEXT_731501 [Caerostris extrusa]|uniref:Uncharacterized protein n=1 Tax=Caerostris extrusa TaxID=172846 RepID=A0AAV4SSQ0_CAEEX|nr:hypothetical protein CEXT_731501 [Caerostris extrusa]